jgi:hypothetical protein
MENMWLAVGNTVACCATVGAVLEQELLYENLVEKCYIACHALVVKHVHYGSSSSIRHLAGPLHWSLPKISCVSSKPSLVDFARRVSTE